jgi:NAD(P)-dependent dehydrogenase (short-subunit alcohol dehydrogenase family)
LDIADRAAVAAYAAAVAEHYGVVHQLYNNAGIAGGGSVVDADYDVYDRVLAVNLGGVINGTKEFLPHLIASGDGHLVNISSLNGIMGQADLSAYCASKFAVRGFTESLRAEMVRDKRPVRVTVVHPGGVATNIADVTPPDADPAQAAHHARRTRVYKEKLLKMPAPTAAAIIVDGVEAGKSRVLVGNDAKGMDLMVRVIPRWYPRVMAWWDRRVFGSD